MVNQDNIGAERSEERKLGDMGRMFRARAQGMFPPEFRQHMIAARREVLLAVRSLIDTRIESLECQERASSKKATKLPVE
jgi:hypothetical protein